MAEPHRPGRRIDVLYAGPALAGVRMSVHYLHSCKGLPYVDESRVGLVTETSGGQAFELHSDVRSSYYFPSLDEGLRQCRAPDADAHMRHLVAHFEAHREFLRRVDVVVFVVDSRPQRTVAAVEHLARVRLDLQQAGRDPDRIPFVFQCNWQDVEGALAPDAFEELLHAPRRLYLPSIAIRGVGVVAALRAALSLATTTPSVYR